jgi:hypothetical protein
MLFVKSSITNHYAIVLQDTQEIQKLSVKNWNVKSTPIAEQIKYVTTTNALTLALWRTHALSMPSAKGKITLRDVLAQQVWLVIPMSIVKLWNVTSIATVTVAKPVFKMNVSILVSWTMSVHQQPFAGLSTMMHHVLVLLDMLVIHWFCVHPNKILFLSTNPNV